MDISCLECDFVTPNISDICKHLKKTHLLLEGSKLNLRCCFGCSLTFKTYSGFRKHLLKCQFKPSAVPLSCSPENSAGLQPLIENEKSIIENEQSVVAHDIQCSEHSKDEEKSNDAFMGSENDIENQIMNFILKMYSLGLPDTTIDTILQCTAELVFPILDDFLEQDNIAESTDSIENFKIKFENQMTKYKRNKAFKKNSMLEPVKKSHGIRLDQVYDSTLGIYKQVPVTCTFSYVPILQTLELLFKNEIVRKEFLKERTPNPEAYTHFVDGDLYRTCPFFIDNPNAIQIQIYFDEFEVCNPLGSKTGSHKIGAFYFVINNFPMQLNSYLENIHLLALCYNADIKRFGINPVLDVIVSDLKILENEGVFIEDLDMSVKGTLVSLSHDNLGGATLLGMVESFQANHYCRICLMKRHDCQVTCTQTNILLRTAEHFKEHAEAIAADDSLNNVYGIKHRSPLNDLAHFNSGRNYTVDIGHDILEGVVQTELKRFVISLVEDKICSLDDINQRIFSFDYGLENIKNKPSPINISNPGSLIGQRAAQTHCLIIFLTLILKDIVEKFHEKHMSQWKVILLLIKIVKIVFAPQIKRDAVNELRLLIQIHNKKFIQAYSAQLTPKHHFLTHYPMIIENMGPPKSYWTLRYESKHGPFKDLANKLKNFKNICHTLAYRHQQNVLYAWDNFQSFEPIPSPIHFKCSLLENNEYCALITETLNISPDTNVEFDKTVCFKGARLMLNRFVCTRFSNNLPVFGKTLSFFCVNSVVYVVCKLYDTLEISDEFLGYSIEDSTGTLFITRISELNCVKSYRSYTTPNTNCEYIITEYFL